MFARFFAIPLWQRTAAGFILGIIAGLILRESAVTWLQPIGDLYLNLIRMVVAPLVLFTIASSIAKLGEGAGAVRLGVKTILWFAVTSLLAVNPMAHAYYLLFIAALAFVLGLYLMAKGDEIEAAAGIEELTTRLAAKS